MFAYLEVDADSEYTVLHNFDVARTCWEASRQIADSSSARYNNVRAVTAALHFVVSVLVSVRVFPVLALSRNEPAELARDAQPVPIISRIDNMHAMFPRK